MRFHFIPAECGDFRLERDGDGACVLTVVDPTSDDRQRLDPFFKRARELEWFDEDQVLASEGETIIRIAHPLAKVGEVLAGETARPSASTWTALRYEKGVYVVDGVSLTNTKDAIAAATVSAPNKGCPAPAPCARRPWEVLQAFSTARQMDEYRERGRMPVIGGATGRLYHVHHRDEAARLGLARCVTVGATGAPMCMWEARVPPEEETLALMLALQHREPEYLAYEMQPGFRRA